MVLKKIATLTAVVVALVPATLAVRKRMRMMAAQNKLARAKEAGRKIPHAAKPRKARRIARRLAKTIGQTA